MIALTWLTWAEISSICWHKTIAWFLNPSHSLVPVCFLAWFLIYRRAGDPTLQPLHISLGARHIFQLMKVLWFSFFSSPVGTHLGCIWGPCRSFMEARFLARVSVTSEALLCSHLPIGCTFFAECLQFFSCVWCTHSTAAFTLITSYHLLGSFGAKT